MDRFKVMEVERSDRDAMDHLEILLDEGYRIVCATPLSSMTITTIEQQAPTQFTMGPAVIKPCIQYVLESSNILEDNHG